VRGTPMRDTPVRGTSMRGTSMRGTFMRGTSMRHSHERHAHERHSPNEKAPHERPAHERGPRTRGMPMRRHAHDVFNLDLLGLCVCKALENITPAGRDMAVPYYGQRKLVGRRLVGEKQKFQIPILNLSKFISSTRTYARFFKI